MSLIVCIIVTSLISITTEAADRDIDFQSQIAPLFEQHCLSCHSPGIDKGGLSLATAQNLHALDFISIGDPDSSYLIDMIAADGETPPQMPKKGEPLTTDEVNLIREWIKSGATWPEDVVLREPSKADKSWWSLQPISESLPPSISEITGLPESWNHNPVDKFVAAKLNEQGLAPSPAADRRSLIRRATYDLTGLPPTPEEVTAFEQETDPLAYEKLIDRLLASPRYGERWGRHWLDVVRFGESNGFERNVIINNLWPFRDYVIESFNADKPFDQLIREHLAGDVLNPDDPNSVIGSAFLVCGPYDNVGNQDAVQAAQIRANTIDEVIRASSEAFLGMTIGCARCHDHKFDPIQQADYYRLYATFAGVKHGARVVATPQEIKERNERVAPLNQQRAKLTKERDALNTELTKLANQTAQEHEQAWTRPSIARIGTEDTFPPVTAKWIKFISIANDSNLNTGNGFRVDEFEVYSTSDPEQNVALASNGSVATGPSRIIEDFPGAYGPQLAIDGKFGARFISTSNYLQIELPTSTEIHRVKFSSARNETMPQQRKFTFVAEYKIEISLDGKAWTEVANGRDRQPINKAHRQKRLKGLTEAKEQREQIAKLNQQINTLTQKINAIPQLQSVWVGNPFPIKEPQHIFIGGSPQRKGEQVLPASLSLLSESAPKFELNHSASEAERRKQLANWIANEQNPLTTRVLANRLWHYHFGAGIVNTPNDFGYMGGRPSHPKLLDWLANQLIQQNWKLKPLHKQIMLSQTYQQAIEYRKDAAAIDGDSRLLWRFPPRRLSAEEIRDTMLKVSGKLDLSMGGPGFRLYKYLQDNVATYVPLDQHGPETYRRAVYHQNARAARTDLMTDFDQPDCAFSSPRRAETTTPLQALSTLNHSFTLDMANALSERIITDVGEDQSAQIEHAWNLCFVRAPTQSEKEAALVFLQKHTLAALCRVLLNTSELIYVN